MRNTELIMLVGIPGSGKSMVAERYAQQGCRVHSSDAVREMLYGKEEIQGKAHEVFSVLMRDLADDLQAGYSCVADATNLSRKRRIAMLSSLSGKTEKKTCVLVLADPDTCLERNGARQRTVPPERLHDMLCSFETPYYYEGWDRIETAFTGDPYVFPREKAASFPQDNPYHSLTLGAHLDAARDYCEAHGFSKAVQEAAWYHDVGKLYTKRFSSKRGDKTDYAHYYGHENYGAYLYLCEKGDLAVRAGTWEDVLHVANLINWHMRSMTSWRQNPSRREKDRKLMGESMYLELMQLYESDQASH